MGPGRVIVTGARGFVGRAVCAALSAAGAHVVGTSRESARDLVQIGPLGPDTEWSEALAGAVAVVHLAARVHVIRETASDPLGKFRRANLDGTRRLAAQAAAAGVRRFVFISTVKVNGESTNGRAFQADDAPTPAGPYAQSKFEAEQALGELAAETGLEVVIVRPPLVYGPGVSGNFVRLMRLVARGYPLPFKGVQNRRSLVAVDNLAHLLVRCVTDPRAAGETFLVSDGEDLSTEQLVRKMAAAMGAPQRLFRAPPVALRALELTGWGAALVGRLYASLQVDSSKTRRLLDWTPPIDVDAGIAAAVAWYKSS